MKLAQVLLYLVVIFFIAKKKMDQIKKPEKFTGPSLIVMSATRRLTKEQHHRLNIDIFKTNTFQYSLHAGFTFSTKLLIIVRLIALESESQF